MKDDPKLLELAKQASADGDVGAAAVIGYVIRTSNQDAQNIIATELAALKSGDDNSKILAQLGANLLGAVMGGTAKAPVRNVGPVFRTNKDAAIAADELGFQKTNYTSNGQAVFKKDGLYITRDVDGHNGGGLESCWECEEFRVKGDKGWNFR